MQIGAAGHPFLLFRTSGRLCALAAESVQEVVPIAATAEVPGQPSILGGFLNLRGRAVPVVLLGSVFGFEGAEPGLWAPIIIVEHGGAALGLLADSVENVVPLETRCLAALPEEGSFNGCATAQTEFHGEVVTVLAAGRILLEQERQRAAELAAEVERRSFDAGVRR